MSKTKDIKVDGVKITLQSVSPRWFFEQQDHYGIGTSDRNLPEYMHILFQNVVVSPPDIRNKGLDYFDDDIGGAEELFKEINSFLRGRKKSEPSKAEGGKE